MGRISYDYISLLYLPVQQMGLTVKVCVEKLGFYKISVYQTNKYARAALMEM